MSHADFNFISHANQTAHREAEHDIRYLSEHGDTAWHINNSSWAEYTARIDFPDLRKSLDSIIDDLNCESSVGLDIAGGKDGVAMLDLIQRGVLSRAAVTNFEDHRSDYVKKVPQLDHISGNLLSPLTWQKIFEWQHSVAPSGLKLITHEPRNTLQWLQPDLYSAAAHNLIDMLAGGGALLSQIPKSLSRRERNLVCRNLEQRPDVAATFTSNRHSGYRQALIVKA